MKTIVKTILHPDQPTELQTKHFTLWLWDFGRRGAFEHNELGDELGGGLWFEDSILVDYDGVYELPEEVMEAILELGYEVQYDAPGVT